MGILINIPDNSDVGGPFITLRNTSLAHSLVPSTYKEYYHGRRVIQALSNSILK